MAPCKSGTKSNPTGRNGANNVGIYLLRMTKAGSFPVFRLLTTAREEGTKESQLPTRILGY